MLVSNTYFKTYFDFLKAFANGRLAESFPGYCKDDDGDLYATSQGLLLNLGDSKPSLPLLSFNYLCLRILQTFSGMIDLRDVAGSLEIGSIGPNDSSWILPLNQSLWGVYRNLKDGSTLESVFTPKQSFFFSVQGNLLDLSVSVGELDLQRNLPYDFWVYKNVLVAMAQTTGFGLGGVSVTVARPIVYKSTFDKISGLEPMFPLEPMAILPNANHINDYRFWSADEIANCQKDKNFTAAFKTNP